MIRIALVVVLLDQATKYWVISTFHIAQSRPLITGVFHLTYVVNTGGAFGLLQGWGLLLIAISLVAILVILWMARAQRPSVNTRWLHDWALALILGGAFGNLIDRVRLGHVVDFLDFRVWPVFNVADMAITCGVGFIIVEMFTARTRQRARSNE